MLRVSGLTKSYGSERVLGGVDLQLAAAETLAILGRSGSGKTTLLKIIAGLTPPDGGVIEAEPGRMVYLYQEPLLFPHLDVFENVAFGLRLQPHAKAAVAREVSTMLEQLGLAEHAGKRVDEISGGQRQRTAFGRALVVKPRALLLDEPFAALDGETRAAMQVLFNEVARAHGIATLFVTHDLKEALTVGDRLAYLRDGVLTAYPSRAAFLADERVGAQDEIRFWTRLT